MLYAENKSNTVIKSQKTRVLDSPRLHGTIAHIICSSPWDSLGKNTGVVCHFLLQGNLPDPGIKPRFSTLQADSLPFEPPGKLLTQQGDLQGNLQNWAICNSLSFLLIWQMWRPMGKSPVNVTQLGGDAKGVWLVDELCISINSCLQSQRVPSVSGPSQVLQKQVQGQWNATWEQFSLPHFHPVKLYPNLSLLLGDHFPDKVNQLDE